MIYSSLCKSIIICSNLNMVQWHTTAGIIIVVFCLQDHRAWNYLLGRGSKPQEVIENHHIFLFTFILMIDRIKRIWLTYLLQSCEIKNINVACYDFRTIAT